MISERYDHRHSTALNTNRAFKDWPKVIPDALNSQVNAERLTGRRALRARRKGLPTARDRLIALTGRKRRSIRPPPPPPPTGAGP